MSSTFKNIVNMCNQHIMLIIRVIVMRRQNGLRNILTLCLEMLEMINKKEHYICLELLTLLLSSQTSWITPISASRCVFVHAAKGKGGWGDLKT